MLKVLLRSICRTDGVEVSIGSMAQEGRLSLESNFRPNISVVIPVYNSEGSLEELVQRLEKVLLNLCEAFEIVLVNDSSHDNSWDKIRGLAKQRDYIRGIDLMRNYGQHNALLCGIRAAMHPIIVTMDDDLQHPPEELPKLLSKLNEGYDVVYGPPKRERHGFWRDFASVAIKFALQTVMGAENARNVSAYRLFRAQVCKAFDDYRGAFVNVDVLLSWGTTRFGYVRVRHDVRKIGSSNYTLRKLFSYAINMLTGFSVVPLQVASFIGFGVTLFGILLLIYAVGKYFLYGNPVPGFTFLVSIICVFSGAQLFTLGVFGEYLARIHFRIMEKPPYLVRTEV